MEVGRSSATATASALAESAAGSEAEKQFPVRARVELSRVEDLSVVVRKLLAGQRVWKLFPVPGLVALKGRGRLALQSKHFEFKVADAA